MKKLRLMIAAVAVAAGMVQSAPVVATNQGRFESAGNNNTGVADQNNYISGQVGTFVYRNFFVFNLASLSGTVASASLNLAQPSGGFNSVNATETYQLWDVSNSSLSSLTSTGVTGATGVFTDLGTGTLLGSLTLGAGSNGTTVSVAFNSAGLAAIQSALGGMFAVGGIISGSGTSPRYSFGGTTGSAFQALDINLVGTPPVSGVPEPGTILTLGAGLLAVGVARFRKNQHKS